MAPQRAYVGHGAATRFLKKELRAMRSQGAHRGLLPARAGNLCTDKRTGIPSRKPPRANVGRFGMQGLRRAVNTLSPHTARPVAGLNGRRIQARCSACRCKPPPPAGTRLGHSA